MRNWAKKMNKNSQLEEYKVKHLRPIDLTKI